MTAILFRFIFYTIIIYLAGAPFTPAVAANQPTAEQEIHFCGGTGLELDEPHYDQFSHRRYARTNAANLNVGEPRTVRMIYFLPNDRPYRAEVVQKMKDEMLNIQNFYAEQMAAHGYGDLAFRYETDPQGDPMVNHIDGEHPDSHYLYDTTSTVLTEINMDFELSVNVYLIVIDNSMNAIGRADRPLAGGVGTRRGRNGGFALVAGGFSFGTAAHELGHAFGLKHDFRDNAYIMSYGGGQRARFSACHAEFLSVHPYFNLNTSTEDGHAPTIELISSRVYPARSQSVPLHLKVNDTEGVHQVLLFVKTIEPHSAAGFSELKACRVLAGENDTVVEFDYDGVIPSLRLNNLTDSPSQSITFNVVDRDGYVSLATFTLVETSPYHITTFRNSAGSNAVAFSPNGKTIAAGGNNRKLQLWDLETQVMRTSLELPYGHLWVNTLSFSPNGIMLAGGGWEWAALWDVVTGGIIASFRSPSTVNSVSISPNEVSLAAGGSDGTLQVWNVATEQNIATFKHTDRVNSVALSLDGNILASGSDDHTVKLWNVATQQEIATLVGHTESVTSVAFSPDGTTVASGAFDRMVKLWDVETHQDIATLQGDAWGERLVSFSPDGTTLAITGDGYELELWDIMARVNYATLGYADFPKSVVFSRHGTILAATMYDGTVEVWDAAALMEDRHVALTEIDIPDTNLRTAIATNLRLPLTNSIRTVHLNKLIRLRAENTDISNLTGLDSAIKLKSLDLSGNNISDISPLAGMTNLIWLRLSYNSISDISSVAGLTSLTMLRLSGNNISDISSVSGLTNLTWLSFRDSNVSEISAIEGLTGLRLLFLDNNNISDISPLAGLTNLTTLILDANSISDISAILGLTNLTSLSLTRNPISDISAVSGLTNLTSLHISDSNISDISPLSGLTNLATLGLFDGNISDISPLSGLTNLQLLYLSDNSIRDISPLLANAGLGEGDTVDLQRNPLSYESIFTHIPILQERGVEVYFDYQSPVRIRIVSGDDQQGLPSTTLEKPFVVEVRDESNKPIQGVPVTFTVTAGGGTLSVTQTATDEIGRAKSTLTLGSDPGANTVRVRVEGYGEAVATLSVEAVKTPMFTLSIPAGTHSIHIPLAANRINGEDGTIETVGDVYDALGGKDAVNLILTLGDDGNWVPYLGDEHAGTLRDGPIGDETGLVVGMKRAATLELSGLALGSGGAAEINILPGNNAVGVPLDPANISLISDLLVEGVAAIAVSNAAGDGFNTISKYYLADDGPLMGGVGYVVVATEETSISIQGSAWENQGAAAAPAAVFDDSQTPVLYVEGGVIDEFDMLARIPELRLTVKNLSTGGSLDTVLGTETSAKTYSATFVELRRRAAKAGDVLNIAAHSPNPYVGVRPVPQIVVSADEVLNSRIKLPDLELYEIPSETELLANYPNPFNPETWIPYRLAKAAEVTLEIYDTNGSLVRTIDLGFKPAAVYESRASAIHWDGRNASGELVASGVYFYHLSAGDYSATRRMVILK